MPANGNNRFNFLGTLRSYLPIENSQRNGGRGAHGRERSTGSSWNQASQAESSRGGFLTDRPTLSRQRLRELSTQKIQEIPIEAVRFSNRFVTFKQFDKNRMRMGYSRASKRSALIERVDSQRPLSAYRVQ